MSRTRYYGICRAADRAKVNAAIDALGHGSESFNMEMVRLADDQDATPTNYACNWDVESGDVAAIESIVGSAGGSFAAIGTSMEIRADSVRPMSTRTGEINSDQRIKPRRADD